MPRRIKRRPSIVDVIRLRSASSQVLELARRADAVATYLSQYLVDRFNYGGDVEEKPAVVAAKWLNDDATLEKVLRTGKDPTNDDDD